MTTRPTPQQWALCFKPNPTAKVRLFCLPNAGGGAFAFRAWAYKVPETIEVCPIQLPGRENRLREKPFTDVAALVEALAEALGPQLTLPFAFFGHSMGALIAFELTRYLRRQGIQPVHLFVSARSAPQVLNAEPVLHQLPDDQLIEQLRKLNGTPEEIIQNLEVMQALLPLLRADLTVNEAYTYTQEEPLDMPISAFGGLEDQRVKPATIKEWAMQTRNTFKFRMLPGDHFFIHSAQARLLQVLSEEVLQAVADHTDTSRPSSPSSAHTEASAHFIPDRSHSGPSTAAHESINTCNTSLHRHQ
jgi:medium-chain acyl-[acyl-carrier-protein] hydrolase